MNHIVCGRMKMGKTTLAKWLAGRHSPGVIAWDPRNMIDGHICYGPDALQQAIDEKRFATSILVYRFDNTDVMSEFSAMCSVLFPPGFTYDNFSLVVDEAAQLQRSNWIHPDLDRAVRQHPRGVNIFQATHSLQDYARSSRDLTSDLYAFSLIGKSLESIISFCDGDDAMREAIRNLPPHHLIHWSHTSGSWEVWNDPSVWYTPLEQPVSFRDKFDERWVN